MKPKQHTIDINHLKDMIAIIGRDFKIKDGNKALLERTGWAKRDILGKYCYKVGHNLENPCRIPHGICPLREILRTGKPTSKIHIHFDKWGNKFYADISASPLKDKNGKIIGVIEAMRDITRQRQLEQLRSEFISIVAHQLLEPMVDIRWGISKLKEDFDGRKEILKDIYWLNSSTIELVEDLLKMVKIESQRFKTKEKLVDPQDILKKLIKEKLNLPEGQRNNIKLFIPKKPLSKIRIDPSVFREIMNNIIDNAIKYNSLKYPIKITIKSDKKKLLFICEDRGLGIPNKERDKVFTKFFRSSKVTRRGIRGTGLGLYITKLLVERYQGKIWFSSRKKPRGTTFYFTLPATKRRSPKDTTIKTLD